MADPYLQPNGTLKNKLDITSAQHLQDAETDYSRNRSYDIGQNGPKGTFDFERLKATHHHLFQDVYDWAGQARTVNLYKAQSGDVRAPLSRFDDAVVIQRNAADLFGRLKAENNLRGLSREAFAGKAAEYFCEVNKLHPFREGNGRTQRAFFEALAEQAGHRLDFRGVTRERMVQASIEAHGGKRDMMHRIFDEASTPNRAAALHHAVMKLDSLGFARTDETYITTAQPGLRQGGVFVGRDDKTFLIHTGKAIVVGDPADLKGSPKNSDRVEFSATSQFKGFAPAAPARSLPKPGGDDHELERGR